MPATLSCTISKIITIPNKVNADIVSQYQEYMRDNGASERHQNNALWQNLQNSDDEKKVWFDLTD
jgi:hypothetical protein